MSENQIGTITLAACEKCDHLNEHHQCLTGIPLLRRVRVKDRELICTEFKAIPPPPPRFDIYYTKSGYPAGPLSSSASGVLNPTLMADGPDLDDLSTKQVVTWLLTAGTGWHFSITPHGDPYTVLMSGQCSADLDPNAANLF